MFRRRNVITDGYHTLENFILLKALKLVCPNSLTISQIYTLGHARKPGRDKAYRVENRLC